MTNQKSVEEAFIVLTTEIDGAIAESLAKELLSRKLAACVHLREVRSYFTWKGQLEQTNEVQLLIKTNKSRLENLLDVINQLHSYQTPELLYWSASASDAYKEWIQDSLLHA